MAGRGPKPKDTKTRRRANAPARGDWKPAPGIGWQHGTARKRIPDPPDGLVKSSREAWNTWMRAWFAAFWTPADLPALSQIIKLYDAVERGELQRASELRLQMDTYGITPKGQQDRRWAPPKSEDAATKPTPPKQPKGRYGHLRVLEGTPPPADALEA